jgi:Xaa-Pro aminopeptidase
MVAVDKEKETYYKSLMREAGLDAIIVRYPENVLYFSNYYPITGWASVIVFAEEDPVMIVPDSELKFTNRRIINNLTEYQPGGTEALIKEYKKLDLKGKTVGIEQCFESIGASNLHYEISFPNKPFFDTLAKEFPNSSFKDATDILYKMREYKTEMELENYRFLNKIQAIGLQAAAEAIKEEMTEMRLATICESAIMNSIEQYCDKIDQIRAFAFVMGGKNGKVACWPYNISTAYKMKKGEWCMMELNTQVNGYWSDLTRTWVVGRNPNEEQKRKAEVLNNAIKKAVDAMREGLSMHELDKASRAHIVANGLGEFHTPFLGHGIGVKLHEPFPLSYPNAKGFLKKGHLMTIEPGLYFEDGALRFERIAYLNKENKGELIDPFPCEL